METVIVGIDGVESERALPAARGLAERFLARIVVVHVNQLVGGGVRGARFPRRADEDQQHARAREIVAELRREGFDADLEACTTTLTHEASIIADAARRQRAGAIVVATRRQAPLAGIMAGSLTQRLLREAPCPVVVVTPESRRDAFRTHRRAAAAAAAAAAA